MVWEAENPCTIVIVTLRVLRFSLIRRSAGVVYMSVSVYPARATSVMVSVPALTVKSAEHAPTGTVTVFVPYLKVKLPVTPVPSASLQICSRPCGMGVGVGAQLGAQLGVEVAVLVGFGVFVGVVTTGVGVFVGGTLVVLVKMTSVTPVPILTTTFPIEMSLLISRLANLTWIIETT